MLKKIQQKQKEWYLFILIICVFSLTAVSFPPCTLCAFQSVQPGEQKTSVSQKTLDAIAASITIQSGTPIYIKNFLHTEQICNWMGVSGQVFGADGKPLKDLVVQVGGVLSGKTKTTLSRTGSATAYGDGGYELVLADSPTASKGTLWLEVYNEQGIRLSERVVFDTYADCERNLLIINFTQATSLPTPTGIKTATSTLTPPSTPTKVRLTLTSTRTAIASPLPSLIPMPSPTPTAIPEDVFYIPQTGSPRYLKNFNHPEFGCKWLGMGGQVFDALGKPVLKVVVEVKGNLNNRSIFSLTLTGNTPAYGAGGYELMLAESTANSSGSLWLQLYNLKGKPISDKLPLTTFADCQKNQIIYNFVVHQQIPTPTKPASSPTPPSGDLPFFEAVSGSPLYVKNLYHPSLGCQWMGIGGQVFDVKGQPIQNLVIEVGGMFNGKPFMGLSYTGVGTAYGQGGFEVQLSSKPLASKESLWIVVHDLQGHRLSNHLYFDTFADCDKNLILFHLTQQGKK